MSQIVFKKETSPLSGTQTPLKQQRSCKIFVGGIPHKTNEEDLLSHFTAYGEVAKVKIPVNKKNQKSRGFAFVEFKTEEAVLATLADPTHLIKGKQVSVRRGMNSKKARKHTKSLQKKKLFIEGLEQLAQEELEGLTEADFRRFFERFGQVERVLLPRECSTRRLRGFLYVIMSDDEGFNSALAAKDRIFFKGAKLRIRGSKSVREIKKDRAIRQSEQKVETTPRLIVRSSGESSSGSLSHRSPAFNPASFKRGRPLLTALSSPFEAPGHQAEGNFGASDNCQSHQNGVIRERRRMAAHGSESPSVECQDSCSRTDESELLTESLSSMSSRWHPKSVSQSSYLASKFGLASQAYKNHHRSRWGAPVYNRQNHRSYNQNMERQCRFTTNSGSTQYHHNDRFVDRVNPNLLTGESLIQRHNLIFKPPRLAEALALREAGRRYYQPEGERNQQHATQRMPSNTHPSQLQLLGPENSRNQLTGPLESPAFNGRNETSYMAGNQVQPHLENGAVEGVDEDQPNVEIRQVIKTEYKIRVEGYIYTGCITETNEWGTRQGEEDSSPSEILQ